MKRVVVTGIGIVSCIGNDQKTVIKNLKELNSGISTKEVRYFLELIILKVLMNFMIIFIKF